MPQVMEALTPTELATLASYEAVIQQGLESFVEVGNALAAVRDGRLYRSEFGTFEEYCQSRWSLTRQHVNRLVAAAEIVTELEPTGSKPETERQVRPLVQVPKEERAAVWQEAVETAPKDESGTPKVTAAHVQAVVDEKLGKRPHVANNSGNNEWYTPPNIIEAARTVLGSIDCDPASSEVANRVVKAKKIYTVDDCGLAAKKWGKRVWMNPPYAQPLCEQFCASLVERYARADIEHAIVLVNNATETNWFRGMVAHASAVLFLAGRVKFLDDTGEPRNTPLQGQAVLYFGERMSAFLEGFAGLGWGAIVQ